MPRRDISPMTLRTLRVLSSPSARHITDGYLARVTTFASTQILGTLGDQISAIYYAHFIKSSFSYARCMNYYVELVGINGHFLFLK